MGNTNTAIDAGPSAGYTSVIAWRCAPISPRANPKSKPMVVYVHRSALAVIARFLDSAPLTDMSSSWAFVLLIRRSAHESSAKQQSRVATSRPSSGIIETSPVAEMAHAKAREMRETRRMCEYSQRRKHQRKPVHTIPMATSGNETIGKPSSNKRGPMQVPSTEAATMTGFPFLDEKNAQLFFKTSSMMKQRKTRATWWGIAISKRKVLPRNTRESNSRRNTAKSIKDRLTNPPRNERSPSSLFWIAPMMVACFLSLTLGFIVPLPPIKELLHAKKLS
ncbi:hypothetical protein [Gordonibacter urolithinfaciens]|uniref:hypothetical protein n=1 Tax=Gordonibacter urolithinfaciens TaxID=1335613 RepID=UPI001D0817A1|nr:hypothetical protein [Gordonibacter urolithinfaciens]MCB6562329.1 hypothetical protein [Gordonibacter urolithinfaciens]MCB7086571.1 hypothetical protein [Gordonibacter urolithinfaciens]